MSPRKIARLSLLLLAMTAGAGSVHAQDLAPYYKGKTITIVVGSSAGGGYDTYARLMGRYLGKHIPGEPAVVVSNKPGAGSEVAAGYVANAAPKDGTFIAAPFASQPLDPILEQTAGTSVNPSRLNYLGSAMSDDYLCIVRPDAPAKTFNDTFKTQVIVGASAPTAESGLVPTMLDNMLGTKFKVVFGYPGAREITMAIEKGEIQGMCGMGWLSLKSEYLNMLKKSEVKIIVQANIEGLPEINKMGVPLTVSYARNDQQRRIFAIVYSQEVFARPYFVAPEVPADRLQVLRRAFMETWRDPALLEDAAKMHLDVAAISGDKVQSLIRKVYASPPALLQSVKEAVKRK